MDAPEVTFSDLQLLGDSVVERLEQTPSRSLSIRGPDAEDLVLMTAERAEHQRTVTETTSRMFAALMQRGGASHDLAIDVLAEVFPWVQFLPRGDAEAFASELVAVLGAAPSTESPSAVAMAIESWRHTAEVFRVPALAEVLSTSTGNDFGGLTEGRR